MIFNILICILLFIIVFALIILLFPNNHNLIDYDYLIVLGNKLVNNSMSDILKNRLDLLIDCFNKTKSKIIVSGGITNNNSISEADVMKNYLIENGVDERQIIIEDKSKTTIENIINCKEIVGDSKSLLISSNYHLLRIKIITNKCGLNVEMLGSKTPFFQLLKHLLSEEYLIMKTILNLIFEDKD